MINTLPGQTRFAHSGVLLLLLFVPFASSRADEAAAAPDPTKVEYFENHIRPLLVGYCHDCHGANKQWASLRLDSRDGLLVGGDSGPAIVPGDVENSELIYRIEESDPDVQMPPADSGKQLSAEQIAMLKTWVEQGAVWPASSADKVDEVAKRQREHWAFQPITNPAPPVVQNSAWVQNPIDQFVLAKLEAAGLDPSPRVDRRTLIRRATFDLTGLPPTPEDVEAFVRDDSPDAYARLVDRLLASHEYGQHWARHWLDVARYSDTKGYVYAREERFFVQASAYRDWVIRALNENVPYDRFLLLQLAADQAAPEDRAAMAAMGYLTLGRRFLGVKADIMDDRIDVVSRGMLGMTVSCARCHDHKYDPIPTADYYSLYNLFENCYEETVALPPGTPGPTPEFLAELEKRKAKYQEVRAARVSENMARIRGRVADYLMAQRELDKYPIQGFDQILAKTDIHPVIVRRWEAYLARAAGNGDPVFLPWISYAALTDEEFAARSSEVHAALATNDKVNVRIAAAFATPPASMQEVAQRYQQVFAEVDAQWTALVAAATAEGKPLPTSLDTPADEAVRLAMYSPASPCFIPEHSMANIEGLLDSGTVGEIWNHQNEIDRWLLTARQSAPHAVVLRDVAQPVSGRVFRRGNPANLGDEVRPRFLTALSNGEPEPFANGSGRLELAQAIIDPSNPLTSRVWVNRVWGQHFGAGLVRTPSDFGLRAEAPSHPELLDWLATHFMASGWDTKALHRLIMLSETYQQRSDGGDDLARRERAALADPENRLLWRANSRRLTFEEMRDSLLAASGELDESLGSGPVDLFTPTAAGFRRSIYALVDRQFLPGVLRMFDFANPDLHTAQRSETTVPQQALFVLNHPFVAGRTKALATAAAEVSSAPAERISWLYRRVLQRDPSPAQLEAALAFVSTADSGTPADLPPRPTLAWSYGYGEFDELAGQFKGFTPLPHFNGSAWQGGPSFPDATLGWVQLTAAGGHPGDDMQHAISRRWTAPQACTVSVASKVTHEPAVGNGIRCRVVSSRHGLLKTINLHHAEAALDLDAIQVEAGDTLDFVVDHNANLNSDQYFWSVTINHADPAGAAALGQDAVWQSERDFTGPAVGMLDPWQQLAQVLLVSNEFLFVD